MKKINIIKKSDEFSSIIKKRNGVANKYFILNIENNDSNIPTHSWNTVRSSHAAAVSVCHPAAR